MKKIYVVTYENGGEMKTAKFACREVAKHFAMNVLHNGSYPAVKISTCEGMKTLHTETYCK